MSTHHGILLHVVFSTKYRRPLLADAWRDDLFAYVGGIIKDHKAVLLKSGGIEDHVHLLIRFHPEFAVSKTVQLLKSNSSKWINENRKLRMPFQWQRGYGAFSVSPSMATKVKAYLVNQKEHHTEQTFKEEYLKMLDNHGIEYDPRYVFEQESLG